MRHLKGRVRRDTRQRRAAEVAHYRLIGRLLRRAARLTLADVEDLIGLHRCSACFDFVGELSGDLGVCSQCMRAFEDMGSKERS